MIDIGVFQLLPRGRAATDREVVEPALWEVDFAERYGFESVWVTEHHFSGYGRNMPYESVRRSMQLVASKVIPSY